MFGCALKCAVFFYYIQVIEFLVTQFAFCGCIIVVSLQMVEKGFLCHLKVFSHVIAMVAIGWHLFAYMEIVSQCTRLDPQPLISCTFIRNMTMFFASKSTAAWH